MAAGNDEKGAAMQGRAAGVHRRALLAAGIAAAVPAWPAGAPDAISRYERATGGRVGVCAHNLATGAVLSWRAHERFVMCSTFKASLVAMVLARVDAHRESLDRPVAFVSSDLLAYAPLAKTRVADGAMTIAEMCEAAVVLSDNTCANLLLRESGGPAALTRFWRRIGDPVSRLDHDEPALNRSRPGDPHDTTTPAAMAATLATIATGAVLRPESRERLLGWLVDAKTGLRKLRAGLPASWRVGDKTGNNGDDAAGDLAVAWPSPTRPPIVVAVYVQGGKATPEAQDALFATLGRRVAATLTTT